MFIIWIIGFVISRGLITFQYDILQKNDVAEKHHTRAPKVALGAGVQFMYALSQTYYTPTFRRSDHSYDWHIHGGTDWPV